MLRHNLKLFFRNIKNNKGTFLINTFGLGIGIALLTVSWQSSRAALANPVEALKEE